MVQLNAFPSTEGKPVAALLTGERGQIVHENKRSTSINILPFHRDSYTLSMAHDATAWPTVLQHATPNQHSEDAPSFKLDGETVLHTPSSLLLTQVTS